jgi:hypothetical protein
MQRGPIPRNIQGLLALKNVIRPASGCHTGTVIFVRGLRIFATRAKLDFPLHSIDRETIYAGY